MKLFKQMKEKYKNYKISHNMIKIFKSCKKAHSIPIFRLKEYALLAKTAKPHEEKYIKITKYMPNIYYEFDISNNIHLHITIYILKSASIKSENKMIIKNTDMARILYKRNSIPMITGHKFYISNSNSGELIYRSQIDINSIENTSLNIFNDLTNAFIDLICDMIIDSLKLLEW